MKSGGERQTHCTAAREREREREQRTHGRVEEEKPIGGSSKAGDKKKIYLSFFCLALPFSLSLSERPLWDQVAAVQSELNFTWPCCCLIKHLTHCTFLLQHFYRGCRGGAGQSSQGEGKVKE